VDHIKEHARKCPVYVDNDTLIIDPNVPGVYEVDYMGERLWVRIQDDKNIIICEVDGDEWRNRGG